MKLNYTVLSTTYNNCYTLVIKNVKKKEITSFGEILNYQPIERIAIRFKTEENDCITIIENDIREMTINHEFKTVELTILR